MLADDYKENFSGYERDFLVEARQQGLDSKLVREMRDSAISMAVEAGGEPVSDEVWQKTMKRFEGKLTARQVASVPTWWKSTFEGGR